MSIAPDYAAIPIAVRHLMAARGNFLNAAQTAELMNVPQRVANILKAGVAAGTLADPNTAGGSADLHLGSVAFVDSLRALSVFIELLQGGIRRTPIGVPVNLSSVPATGYVVAEGQGKPLTALTMTRTVIARLKAIALLVITDEILKSTSPTAQTFITRELQRAASAALDGAFLAVLADGAPTIASSGTTALDAGADLRALLALVPNYGGRFYFIASPGVANAAATLQDSAGVFVFPAMSPTGGELLGLPCLVSTGLSADTGGESLYLCDASGLAGDVETVTLETTTQADILMVDEPGMNSTTPTPAQMTNLFQTNSAAVKAAVWFGVKKIRSNSVAVLTGINWGEAVTA